MSIYLSLRKWDRKTCAVAGILAIVCSLAAPYGFTLNDGLEFRPLGGGTRPGGATQRRWDPEANKRSWGPEQATGAPDTFQNADVSTAWASLQPDAGEEWLQLDYNPPLCATKVRIHETYNPGAVTGVVLLDAQGTTISVIPVADNTEKAPAFLEVSFALTPQPVKSVRVVLDSKKVLGWNEIDAVELVGPDERGWAFQARASSTYAEQGNVNSQFQQTPVVSSGKRAWGSEQATGAPDTLQGGDIQTAWATRDPDAGEEWLELVYASPMRATMVRIHETYNPGAVTGVVLKDADDVAMTTIPVTDTTEKAPAFLEVPFPLSKEPVMSVRILFDTKKVPGWNEIDAVELVGLETRAWATSATASSTYAEPASGRLQPVEPFKPDVPPPLPQSPPPAPMDPSKRSWGPEQAIGAPDTLQNGDLATAWATLEPDAGSEWLELDYDPTLRAEKVRIHETFNPGAVTGIELKDANNAVMATIPVNDITAKAPAFLEVVFPLTNEPVKSVRVLLNTAKVSGWNEIDAVELVGPNGRGWAVKARASSTYAEQPATPRAPREVTPDELRAPRPASGAPPAGF